MEDAVCSAVNVKETSLEGLVNRPYETFSETLLRMIDERGLTDPQLQQKCRIILENI